MKNIHETLEPQWRKNYKCLAMGDIWWSKGRNEEKEQYRKSKVTTNKKIKLNEKKASFKIECRMKKKNGRKLH